MSLCWHERKSGFPGIEVREEMLTARIGLAYPQTSSDGDRNRDRRPFRCGALLRAPLPTQIERAVDKTNVTIGLRKIAQHAARQRIELFRQQSYVIAAREQTGDSLRASA